MNLKILDGVLMGNYRYMRTTQAKGSIVLPYPVA